MRRHVSIFIGSYETDDSIGRHFLSRYKIINVIGGFFVYLRACSRVRDFSSRQSGGVEADVLEILTETGRRPRFPQFVIQNFISWSEWRQFMWDQKQNSKFTVLKTFISSENCSNIKLVALEYIYVLVSYIELQQFIKQYMVLTEKRRRMPWPRR